MNELELRLERIEDAILVLAEAVESKETENVYQKVGEALFEINEE